MKPWQKGIPLDNLKAIAAPFKSEFKKTCFGQFSMPREADIAKAISEDRCTWVRASNSPGSEAIAATALFMPVKMAVQQTDFTGRPISIPSGDLYIKALAYQEGLGWAAENLLRHFLLRGFKAVWCEIPEEYAGLKAIALALGFLPAAFKIAASSDIRGLYVAGPEASARIPSALDPAELPALARLSEDWLSIKDQAEILYELTSFQIDWADHYSNYNKRNSWSAFALRGYDPADPNFIIKPAEMSKEWKAENPDRLTARPQFTPMAKHFPRTLAIVEKLPGFKDRVRFMKLAAMKGELTRHADITDRSAGVADGKIARLHMPIVTNPAVEFRNWDARGSEVKTHMPERSLYYLDQRKPHTAVNRGDQDRIHLVVDLVSSEVIRSMIISGVTIL